MRNVCWYLAGVAPPSVPPLRLSSASSRHSSLGAVAKVTPGSMVLQDIHFWLGAEASQVIYSLAAAPPCTCAPPRLPEYRLACFLVCFIRSHHTLSVT